MKKMLLFLLPFLMLAACNNEPTRNENGATETSTTQRYAFDLTKDNLWYFIESAQSSTGNSTYTTLHYTFKGVLSYAYYDNVVVNIRYSLVGRGEPGSSSYPSTSHTADIAFKLNAAGSGTLSLSYEYVPENAVPAITQNNVSGFNRSLNIMSVTGVVRFAI
jgi:hypothetical protein